MTLVRFYCSRRKLYRSYVCRYLRTGGGALSIESIFMIVNLGSVINCGSLASSFEIHPSRINLTLITSNQSSHLRQRNESVFTFTIGNLCVFSLGWTTSYPLFNSISSRTLKTFQRQVSIKQFASLAEFACNDDVKNWNWLIRLWLIREILVRGSVLDAFVAYVTIGKIKYIWFCSNYLTSN